MLLFMAVACLHMKMWFPPTGEMSTFELTFLAQNSSLPLYVCLVEAFYSSNMRLGYAIGPKIQCTDKDK